jgi:hypothetical protein
MTPPETGNAIQLSFEAVELKREWAHLACRNKKT